MGMRRPNLVQPNSHTGDCITALQAAEDAFPSDKILCRWVQLQRIADEFTAQALAEEDAEITVPVRDARVRSAHAHFARQVSEWEARNSSELRSSKHSLIKISFCMTDLIIVDQTLTMTWLTFLQAHCRWLSMS